MRIYISGPITGHHDYEWKFAETAKKLENAGYAAVNPAALNAIMPRDATYEEYMIMCFQLLDLCDGIWLLEGWEQSKGANREYGYALAKGICVLNDEVVKEV